MKQDREAAISARAHQLWEESGHAHSQHDLHWREAEREHDDAEAQAATVEQLNAETVEVPPAKPARKRVAKVVESVGEILAGPTRKPRALRKPSTGAAIT